MATARLSATARDRSGKGAARSLRAAGKTPGVIYGHDRQAQSLVLETRDLEKLLNQISPGTTVIELDVDGQTSRTLMREIQRHPFKPVILHVDFQQLVLGEKVTVQVPIVLVGTPEGVREGGILDQTMRELEIEVDPAQMPEELELDVSGLTIGRSLHVSDIKLPPGVEVLDDPEATVCVLAAPRVEEEPEVEATEEAIAEPELIRKPKEEGEEGEGEE